jgi:hypothetical protein
MKWKMPQSRLGLLLALSVFASCGKDTSDSGNDAPTKKPKSSGTPTNTSGEGTGTTGAGTGTTSGGGADSGSATTDLGFYPLKVGYKWTYKVDPGQTTCGGGEVTVEVREAFRQDGIEKFKVDSICNYFGPGAQITWFDGKDVMTQVATSAISRIYSDPPTEGRTWDVNAALNSTWTNAGAVTVEAGAFTDCWKSTNDRWGGWAIYCRGVGPVKGGGDSGFAWELVSFN